MRLTAARSYFHDSTYPIDIQYALQAIDTLATLSELDPECLPLATHLADWTVDNMQAADGHFYTGSLAGDKGSDPPCFTGGQGTMVKAL